MTDKRKRPALLFDVDGTLVDSVYQHVLAWHDALLEERIDLAVWRIHRRIGMSGGLFVDALARETGSVIDAERADRLRRRHARECSLASSRSARSQVRAPCSADCTSLARLSRWRQAAGTRPPTR